MNFSRKENSYNLQFAISLKAGFKIFHLKLSFKNNLERRIIIYLSKKAISFFLLCKKLQHLSVVRSYIFFKINNFLKKLFYLPQKITHFLFFLYIPCINCATVNFSLQCYLNFSLPD